ncbi:hypothetical protein BGZ89_004414, partial [Linnemannia elongata]
SASTNYGDYPGAIFSVRNVNVDNKEFLPYLPSSSQQTQTQVYTHHHLLDSGSASATGSGSGYDRHNQTRRHLQELAQEQYHQNHQVPLNDSDIDDIGGDDYNEDQDNDPVKEEEFNEAQYQFEALQEPYTQAEYYRHYHQ